MGGGKGGAEFRAAFFDEFSLLDVQLADSKRFPSWCQQAGSGHPDRSPVYTTAEIAASNSENPLNKHVGGSQMSHY